MLRAKLIWSVFLVFFVIWMAKISIFLFLLLNHLWHDTGLNILIDIKARKIIYKRNRYLREIPFEQIRRVECLYPTMLDQGFEKAPKCYRLWTKQGECFYATDSTNVEDFVTNKEVRWKKKIRYKGEFSFSTWEAIVGNFARLPKDK